MTEAEWLAADDVTALLRHVAPTASERLNRLYLCGECRRVAPLFYAPEVCLPAVEAGERFADGRATAEECRAAAIRAFAASGFHDSDRSYSPALLALEADLRARLRVLEGQPGATRRWRAAALLAQKCAYIPQPNYRGFLDDERFPWVLVLQDNMPGWIDPPDRRLVDCVYGDPFRPHTTNPAWQTLTMTAVARMIYDAKTFHDLPVLADALEDAGCDDAGLLAHCRADADHARGCWALDAVLGLR